MEEKQITSFHDLKVYQNSYQDMLIVMKQIVPKIPEIEKYDLQDQLRRSSKAIPRLVAEGYAKRHQKAGFQKYIDDAMSECNETIVSICQAKDLYGDQVDVQVCETLIDHYDKTGRQLFKLAVSWNNFKRR
jgi:four helix bundle protein